MSPEEIDSKLKDLDQKISVLQDSYQKHRHTNYDGTPLIDGDIFLKPSSRVYFGAVFISSGTGTPEAVVTAPVGSVYLRDNGGAVTSIYVKESGTGNTGWVAK